MNEKGYSIVARCKTAWENYKILMLLHKIRRTGVKNHGICISPLYLADQNVQEHSYLVATLAVMMYAMFEEIQEYFPPHYVETLLLHDIGETEIGDIADDGAADAVMYKDKEEYVFLSDFVNDFAPEIRDDIMANFSQFQKKHDILYMIDKLEWILFVAYLTPSGDAGSLNYKESHIGLTEQDKHAIEATGGSYCTVDAMVVHFLEHTHGIEGREIFVALIKAVYMDIDGYIPDFVGKLY